MVIRHAHKKNEIVIYLTTMSVLDNSEQPANLAR